MKWSKIVVCASIAALSLQITACKSDNKSPVKARETNGNGLDHQKPGRSNQNGLTQNQSPPVTPNSQNSSQVPASSEMSPEQKCYADLCLSDPNHLAYEDILKKGMLPTPEQKAYFKQHIEPLLQKAMDAHAENIKLTDAAFKEKENDFSEIRFSKIQKQLLKALIYFYKSDLLPEEQTKSIALKTFEYPYMKAYLKVSVQGPESYFKTLYPKLDVQAAAKKEIAEMSQIVSDFNKSLNAKIASFTGSAYTRAQNNEELDPDDLLVVARNSASARILELLVKKDLAADLEKIQISDEALKKIYSDANIHTLFAKRLQSMEKSKTLCEVYFYGAINLFPRSEENEKFSETVELVKETVLSLLKKEDPAYKAIQESKVHYPKETTSVTSTWITGLKNEYVSNIDDIALLKKYDDSTLLTYAIIQAMTKKENYEVCDEMINLEFDDSAQSLDKSVKASWLSVKHPAYAISMLGHEYGHVINTFTKDFDRQKSCLSEKHENKTLYVGEDFSDFISARVAVSLQNSLNKKLPNLGCFFASIQNHNTIKNKDATDPHSGGLFRALQFAVHRKEAIPASCQELAKQQAPKALEACE